MIKQTSYALKSGLNIFDNQKAHFSWRPFYYNKFYEGLNAFEEEEKGGGEETASPAS